MHLFAGPLLNLALHVPLSCTPPSILEQELLRDAGVSAIISECAEVHPSCLPIIHCGSQDEELVVNGTIWLWIRGDRKRLFDRAEALAPRAKFVASLPKGGA